MTRVPSPDPSGPNSSSLRSSNARVSDDGVLVMGAAILHRGRVLAARRTVPESARGRWEFPGGKVEPGERPDAAVVREVAEELGCAIRVTGYLDGAEPIKDGYTLRVAVAALVDGEPVPQELQHDAVWWLGADELDRVAWLDPDVPFLAEVARLLGEGAGAS
jgi:8-oxo-dGTP diphosphatase